MEAGQPEFVYRRHAGAEVGAMSGTNVLYVKLKEKASVRERTIRLGQVAELWCARPADQGRWQRLVLAQVPPEGKHRYVFSALEVLKKIQAEDPQVSVTFVGVSDTVVDCRKKPEKHTWLLHLKTAAVCVVTFIGAAFAIMTFNHDVDVGSIFRTLYELATGEASDGQTVLEWTYSLGLFLGIVIFFNHVSKLKVTDDPTPLEVQMRKYEQDVTTTVIQNSDRQEDGVDRS